MRLAVVYDNRSLHRELSPAWGFSCLVGDDILFDTGGDGPRLLANMAQMELDVGRIKSLVLSHAHGDHTSGLGAILAINKDVTVYLPISFPASFKAQVRVRARVVEVRGPMEIAEGVYTTGEMGSGIREQALAVRTAQGLVVVTGCAHPGIVGMVRRARQIAGDDVYLVMGGFHLGGLRGKELRDIIAEFRRLGVRKVAPCHCTGKRARQMFAAEYGEDFIRAGVGLVLDIGP
ncbi:MAG TPA: MBL fold metallo-hydrolase [Anaerolineae bacterium]|nr:MBL fold metallo-hydrolase [Anaerolineae bacterium]